MSSGYPRGTPKRIFTPKPQNQFFFYYHYYVLYTNALSQEKKLTNHWSQSGTFMMGGGGSYIKPSFKIRPWLTEDFLKDIEEKPSQLSGNPGYIKSFDLDGSFIFHRSFTFYPHHFTYLSLFYGIYNIWFSLKYFYFSRNSIVSLKYIISQRAKYWWLIHLSKCNTFIKLCDKGLRRIKTTSSNVQYEACV